jgi:hypothetical protein
MKWRLAGGRWPSAVLVTSLSCWYLRRSGSGWRSWPQPRQRRGGGVMRPSVLTQVRKPGEGEEGPGLDEAGSGAASLICSATRRRVTGRADRWNLDVRPHAQRQRARCPGSSLARCWRTLTASAICCGMSRPDSMLPAAGLTGVFATGSGVGLTVMQAGSVALRDGHIQENARRRRPARPTGGSRCGRDTRRSGIPALRAGGGAGETA